MVHHTFEQYEGDARAVEILGLPADYFEEYAEEVSTVTPEVVQRVAKEDFRPEDLLLMVVGDSSGFDKPLSSFGEVEEVSLP